ncbi:MAG: FAD-binding oxidoreductase [Pseudomonadota bacterium]
MRVAIIGGGVIGAAIAYFLSRRGAAPVIIEREAIAAAASGKSGGFLARDWCDGSPLAPLAQRSFALHQSLANELSADYGYRPLRTLLAQSVASPNTGQTGGAWLDRAVNVRGLIGTEETTAQVHPRLFTEALVDAACGEGAEVRLGRATGIALEGRRAVGVEVDDDVVAADAVVIAMGPWSIAASDWLGLAPIGGLTGHSIVLRADVPAEAVFFEGSDAAPEVYPRPDGTVYVCGAPGSQPLPDAPSQITLEDNACANLEQFAASIAKCFGDAEVIAAQACYRPIAYDGLPLMGAIPGFAAAYVATGHNCWGILNAPATGEAMAELITAGDVSSLPMSAFDPARFATPRSHSA